MQHGGRRCRRPGRPAHNRLSKVVRSGCCQCRQSDSTIRATCLRQGCRTRDSRPNERQIASSRQSPRGELTRRLAPGIGNDLRLLVCVIRAAHTTNAGEMKRPLPSAASISEKVMTVMTIADGSTALALGGPLQSASPRSVSTLRRRSPLISQASLLLISAPSSRSASCNQDVEEDAWVSAVI